VHPQVYVKNVLRAQASPARAGDRHWDNEQDELRHRSQYRSHDHEDQEGGGHKEVHPAGTCGKRAKLEQRVRLVKLKAA